LPEALEGEQYELLDDDGSSGSAQAAAAPQYVAVNCLRCDTLMHATLDQVGRMITCPDCGKKTRVPSPPVKTAPQSVLTETVYRLDESAKPGERPPVMAGPPARMHFEEQFEELLAKDKARAARGKRRRLDDFGRPVIPDLPLVTGILSFILWGDVLVRWLALSLGLFIAGGVFTIAYLDLASGAGGLGAVTGVCLLAAGAILSILWCGAAASNLLTIVTESSEGHDQIPAWPTQMTEWFPNLLYPAMALTFSVLPGSLVARFLATDPIEQATYVVASILLLLPIALLSQLHHDSAIGVISWKILATFFRCPFSWLLFYLETALLCGACIAAGAYAARQGPLMVVAWAPLYVAAMVLYARLLGRLGWRLAEATAVRD
jgi:hypothetical protein